MSEGPSTSLRLAEHYLDVDRPESALEALGRAGPEAADDARYWELRGLALLRAQRVEEGIESLERGLALDPERLPTLYLLGVARGERDELAQAERLLLKSLELDPDNPLLISSYAEIVARGKQFAKARRLLDEAARIDPEEASIESARYLVAYLEGKDREAGEHSRRWLAADPDDPRALAAFGLALGNRGRHRAGYRRLQQAVSADVRVAEGQEELFRERRLAAHWLMIPLAPVVRFGPGKVWMAAILTILALKTAGLDQALAVFALFWVAYCVYTWVVPPLLRRWLTR